MSYILLSEKQTESFETLKDLFQSISSKGEIVKSVEDGAIKTDKSEYRFARLETEKTAETLKEEISAYREELRNAAALLKKQGLSFPSEEAKKLAAQFAFLDKK